MSIEIITTTKPNEDGEFLWLVHFKSSYFDNDPRMPGTVPIDKRLVVLAKERDEAIEKVKKEIAKVHKRYGEKDDESIEATIVTIENLIPARDSSDDGRLGYHSTNKLQPIEIYGNDSKRYRLAVCLIPA